MSPAKHCRQVGRKLRPGAERLADASASAAHPPGGGRRVCPGPGRLQAQDPQPAERAARPVETTGIPALGTDADSTTTGKPNYACCWACLEPELPTALREPEPAEATETPVPRWRRLLKPQKRTLADGSPHTRSGIIGRHAASFAAGTVWRTVSAPVMNVAQPVAARILTFAPRLAATGAASSSIVASTALRFALSAVSVVGLVLGPALAALSIFREVQKVRKARRELDATRIQLQEELAQYAAQTHQLEQQAATMPTPETAIQTPVAIG